MVLSLALSACGQTGPLYMPKVPARPAVQPAAPAAAEAGPPVGAAIGTATTPPAPAAGVVGPRGNANANDTQAIGQPSPATQIQQPPQSQQ